MGGGERDRGGGRGGEGKGEGGREGGREGEREKAVASCAKSSIQIHLQY